MSTKPDNIEQMASRLPRDVAPARDLWPAIEARLSPRPSRRETWWYGLAASVLVAGGALALWLALGGPATPARQTGDTPMVTIPATQNGSADVRFAALKPQPRATLTSNYRVVERAIAAIEAALQKDPNNLYLRGLLTQAYQDRAALERVGKQAEVNPYLRTDL